jgi:GT2 family glycosyltransferase
MQNAADKAPAVRVSGSASEPPLVSVIILNYNGKIWLNRCLESLYAQTILDRLEIVIADNASTDGSDHLAAELAALRPERAFLLQNGANLGFCEGNNRGAAGAKGEYLFFLNNDTWLEKNCLEQLMAGVAALNADCATPLIYNYEDDSFQSIGAGGFDLLGYPSATPSKESARRIFAAPGCSLLIKSDAFRRLGGFDSEFFMYCDEMDLAWRLALAGYKTVSIPQARMHHRGAAAANPKGGGQTQEFRTNEAVRFYTNRNSMLMLFKNAQHVLLLLAIFHVCALLLESLALLVLVRQWGIVKRAYLGALPACWRLRHHVVSERRHIRALRQHSDFWMLRFLKPWFSRYFYEVKRLLKHGLPKIDPRKS